MPTPRRSTGKAAIRVAASGINGQATTKQVKQHDYGYGKATNRLQLETKRRIYQAQNYEEGV